MLLWSASTPFRRDRPYQLDTDETVFPMPTMAKGTLKITEKGGVATAIFHQDKPEKTFCFRPA
jgi:hypothetical protein